MGEKETLFAKLNFIQQNLKAPKSQFNAFGKYNYRSCEDILEAVKPLLGTAALTLSDQILQIGGRYYVQAQATFWVDGDYYTVAALAREEDEKKGMDASQITGAASSYARKYALNGLFLIDDTKDADTRDNTKQETPKPPQAPQKQKEPTKPMTTEDYIELEQLRQDYAQELAKYCDMGDGTIDEDLYNSVLKTTSYYKNKEGKEFWYKDTSSIAKAPKWSIEKALDKLREIVARQGGN